MKDRINIKDIKISKHYLSLVPRMNKDDDESFEQSVIEDGIREPLTLNQDYVLLDGHSRHSKAVKFKLIQVPFKIRKFTDKLLEEKYVIECNLQRRHLTNYQKIELGIPLLKIESKLAAIRKQSTLKQNNPSGSFDPNGKGKAVDIVAKKLGVSSTMMMRGKAISEKASESLKQKLREGKTEINTVYNIVKKEKIQQERQKQIQNIQIRLPKTVNLFCNDFKNNKIKDNSISLIMTDPDYTNYNIQVYSDLARHAMRVLKDGGSVLCYTGHYILREVLNAVVENGLTHHWLIPVLHSGASSLMFSKRIMVCYKPLLWFTKGVYTGKHVKDVIKSEFQGKGLHEWAQSTVESDYYIKYLTEENEIVYDPFMGQGTFGLSAIKLNRQFIGSDINKKYFNIAQRLLSVKTV